MKKSLLVSCCFVAFISLSFVVSGDEPLYKNLKVLPKRITKPQMDSVMKSFTVALGVRCNFCHVRLNDEQKTWNFASDSNNHKKIARTMMRMTGNINKKYFDVRNSRELTANLEVTCYTCHGGKAHPAKLPLAVKPPADSTAKK
jgi:hypothetical protein